MKVKPIGNRVLLEILKTKSTTNSGIILDNKQEEKTLEGLVAALGSGINNKGIKNEFEFKIGDKVMYAGINAKKIQINEIEYAIIDANEILAIVE